MKVDLGERYKDAIVPDIVKDWFRRPKAFKESMDSLRDNMPHITNVKVNDIVSNDIMDIHYKRWFKVTKKRSGTKRRPMAMVEEPELKSYHKSVYNTLKLPYHKCVYSYEKGKSAADCAAPHVNKFAIFEIDIRGFFPSFTRSIIEEGYYEWLHLVADKMPIRYKIRDKAISELSKRLSIICTASDLENPNAPEAVLPIGIEPSVIISNSFPIDLDNELHNFCTSRKLTYSRYSDNMFISRTTGHIPRSMQKEMKDIIENFELYDVKPFKVNEKKERYIPYWRRQRILGAVVNEKVNVSKSREIWLRSAINHLYYDCIDFIDSWKSGKFQQYDITNKSAKLYRTYRKITGNHSYFCAVNREKYIKYSTQVMAVKILIDEIMYIRGIIPDETKSEGV